MLLDNVKRRLRLYVLVIFSASLMQLLLLLMLWRRYGKPSVAEYH